MTDATPWPADARGRAYHLIARLVPDIPSLCRRFPWPLAALLALIVAIIQDAGALARLESSLPPHILQPAAALGIGLFAALMGLIGLALAAENLGWPRRKLHLISAAASIAYVGLIAAIFWERSARGPWPWGRWPRQQAGPPARWPSTRRPSLKSRPRP